MSPPYSSSYPLHLQVHLKQSQQSKRRTEKGEEFQLAFQIQKPFPFLGYSILSQVSLNDCAKMWHQCHLHSPSKKQNVQVNRESGAWRCIASDVRSQGSLRDWKNLIVVSGRIGEAKVLKSGNYAYLMEGGVTRIGSLSWQGVCSPKLHPILTQGQNRKWIMKEDKFSTILTLLLKSFKFL